MFSHTHYFRRILSFFSYLVKLIKLFNSTYIHRSNFKLEWQYLGVVYYTVLTYFSVLSLLEFLLRMSYVLVLSDILPMSVDAFSDA